jgi:hypothetical protein
LATVEEELQLLDVKVKQLKLDYEQYFAGVRPREPVVLRGEVQKTIYRYSNTPIQNTAQRFKFNAVNSRFQAFKRQWDSVLRQIEAGTYARHVFRARLHEADEAETPRSAHAAPPAKPSLYEAYCEAARSCGQNVKGLTPEKLEAQVRKQEAAIREKLGCDRVDFRVVVEAGKVKLKATAGR